MAQQQQDNDAVRMAGDPTKISAFDLIERNIMRDVESDRKTQFQALESASNQNTFGGLVGRIGLETFDKYRNTLSRVASYVNQAHQMAIDHHNFLVRREELNETGATEMTFTALDIANTANRSVAFDPRVPAEVIRLLAVALMMLDAGAPAAETTALKQQAVALVERNVTTAVEKARRTAFQTLASASNQNTFGGLAGRIGLETVARYRLSETRIKSYINQAYQAAIDHHNFVARRETYDKAALAFTPLSANTDTFNNVIPAEVVRLIVLSYIANDNAAAPTAGPLTGLAEAQQR
jgi:hypothetical protein